MYIFGVTANIIVIILVADSEKVSLRKKEEINKRLEQGLPASNCDQTARGKAISAAKKGKPLTESHKAALAKPKAKYSEERKKETSVHYGLQELMPEFANTECHILYLWIK